MTENIDTNICCNDIKKKKKIQDYSNAVIYIIYNIHTKVIIYVGSTKNLKNRINTHHSHCKKHCNNKTLYKTINNNWEEWKIEKYEDYPCNNKKELTKKEGEIIKTLGSTLNIRIAGRDNREWHIDHRAIRLEKMNQRYLNNKENQSKYYKERYLNKKLQKINSVSQS